MSIQERLKRKTPKKWKRIGNAMVAASIAGAGFAFMAEYKWMSAAVFGLGVIGKFITELATDPE